MRRNYHFSLLKVCALCFAVQFSLQVPCACKAILMVFDNVGTHSACAPYARNQHPVRLIMQVHALRGAICAKATRSRAFGNAVSPSAKRNLREGNTFPRLPRSLIVRDPRRSQLRRSTRSTICVFAPRVPRCSTRSQQCSVVPFASRSRSVQRSTR